MRHRAQLSKQQGRYGQKGCAEVETRQEYSQDNPQGEAADPNILGRQSTH